MHAFNLSKRNRVADSSEMNPLGPDQNDEVIVNTWFVHFVYEVEKFQIMQQLQLDDGFSSHSSHMWRSMKQLSLFKQETEKILFMQGQ